MKLVILHGDNVVESYNRLQKFIDIAKKRNWNIVRISDVSQNTSQALLADSLFEKQKLVIVENANLIDKKTERWLKEKSDNLDTNLVVYHNAPLSKTFLNSLPKLAKIEEFKIPKLIWSFLDSFYPGNARNSLLLLHEVVKKEPIEFVFALLARQLRDLYWVKVDPKSMPYQGWRISKLKRQSSRFFNYKLTEIISLLADADLKSKTTDTNLIDILDFIIVSKLE